MASHRHAKYIKAWADGALIQRQLKDGTWQDEQNPCWSHNSAYRVKPKTVNIAAVKLQAAYLANNLDNLYERLVSVPEDTSPQDLCIIDKLSRCFESVHKLQVELDMRSECSEPRNIHDDFEDSFDLKTSLENAFGEDAT